MQLDNDLNILLSDFSNISAATQELVGENFELKKMMEVKEKKLQEVVNLSTRLEKDLQRKQTMLEMVHQQLVVIPELRMNVGELTEAMMELQTMSSSKDMELTRLKQKHLADLNSLKGEIEKERSDSREEENKMMKGMEEFFRQVQETELASLEKKGEREKQVVVDRLRKVEGKLKRVKADQEEQLEMMRVHIISAKEKASQAGPNSSEIYRKMMMAMQEHYEKQIQELVIKNQFSVKSEGLANNAATPESARKKKKKVSFALTESQDANNEDVADVQATGYVASNHTPEESYESIFAVAANRFSRAKPSNIEGTGEVLEDGRKPMRGNTWGGMGEEGGQEARRIIQQEVADQAISARSTEKVQNRFKFSNISSGMYGAATEFGKFSTVSRGGGHSGGVRGHGFAGGVPGGSHGGNGVRDDQSREGPGGLKRKLFSEPAGPQLLE